MAFCSKCGKQIDDGAKFCSGCGAPTGGVEGRNSALEDNEKLFAILGYIFPILFFIPLLNEKRSDFATFHSNQNLVVLISYVICGIIPIVGWIASVFVFVCVVLGIISAAKGETKEMPLLGRIKIIK